RARAARARGRSPRDRLRPLAGRALAGAPEPAGAGRALRRRRPEEPRRARPPVTLRIEARHARVWGLSRLSGGTKEMPKARSNGNGNGQPHLKQRGKPIQGYGKLVRYPLALDEKARSKMCETLNQVLADTITLRDMYKKHHWQVSGPTF